jgi:DNA-directed RNA polymerase subunit RPC12/RpoP
MLYPYECKDCGAKFDLEPTEAGYDVTYCPYCGSEALKGAFL